MQELYEKLLELGSTIMGIKKAHYQEAYNEEARTGNGPIQTIEPALEERYPGITLCRAPAEFCDKIGWRLCSAYEVVARLLGKKSAPRETELVIALVDEVLKSLALGIEMAFPEKESKESDTDGSLQAVSDTVNGILSQGS